MPRRLISMDASERPRLVVLDAMSLIHRAYHGVPRHFATSTGEPTNAVFGFANILMRIVDELGPDHAAAAFDLPGPTFRDELYEPYKAHRDAPDDALIAQFGRIRQLVEVLGIPIYELESYEADDMLGTLARQAEAEGFDVWLVTGDRDALQLVTPHVRVLSSNPRTGQPLIYDEAAIKKRWGIKPGQVVDFKGLQGDSSDNIPGVKGVGEKTASKLLASYADIDDIYAHLDDIRPAIRRRLEGQEDVANLSRRLATIVCDAPVEFDAERTRLWQADVPALHGLMRELQFRNVVERMTFLETSAQVEADALEVEPTLVQDAEGARGLAEQLAQAERVAVFPYTRGSSWSVELLGLGLAWGGDTAYVSLDGEAGPLEALRDWLEDAKAGKVAFDSKALHQALAARGVELRGVDADLLLAAYVATPSAIPRTLDDLAFRRRGIEVEPALPDPQVAGGPDAAGSRGRGGSGRTARRAGPGAGRGNGRGDRRPEADGAPARRGDAAGPGAERDGTARDQAGRRGAGGTLAGDGRGDRRAAVGDLMPTRGMSSTSTRRNSWGRSCSRNWACRRGGRPRPGIPRRAGCWKGWWTPTRSRGGCWSTGS